MNVFFFPVEFACCCNEHLVGEGKKRGFSCSFPNRKSSVCFLSSNYFQIQITGVLLSQRFLWSFLYLRLKRAKNGLAALTRKQNGTANVLRGRRQVPLCCSLDYSTKPGLPMKDVNATGRNLYIEEGGTGMEILWCSLV